MSFGLLRYIEGSHGTKVSPRCHASLSSSTQKKRKRVVPNAKRHGTATDFSHTERLPPSKTRSEPDMLAPYHASCSPYTQKKALNAKCDDTATACPPRAIPRETHQGKKSVGTACVRSPLHKKQHAVLNAKCHDTVVWSH